MNVRTKMMQFFQEKLTTHPKNDTISTRGYILDLVAEYAEEQKAVLPLYVRTFIQEMKENNLQIDEAINIIQYSIVNNSRAQLNEWFNQEETDNKERFIQGWVNGSREERNPVTYLTVQYPDGTKKRLQVSEKTADTILENMGESR